MPTAAIRGRSFSPPFAKSSGKSTWKSSSVPIQQRALRSCPSDGSSSAPSPGSIAVAAWPRIGSASTERPWRSCALPQSASCSESSVKKQHDPGQTLSEATDRSFPILATLRAQGITHYVMAPLIFSNRIVNAISCGSDTPSGFREADVELFRYLVPTFAPVLEVTAGRRIYGELLATYVARDPCARIMAGAVQRGNVHHIKAAMLLADLRGFSRLTDELPEQRIVELL